MEHVKGTAYLSGYRLKAMLDEFHNTDCGRDCRVIITQDKNAIDIEIRTCSDYAQCFVKTLHATRSTQ